MLGFHFAGVAPVAAITRDMGIEASLPHLEQNPWPSGIRFAQCGQYIWASVIDPAAHTAMMTASPAMVLAKRITSISALGRRALRNSRVLSTDRPMDTNTAHVSVVSAGTHYGTVLEP